MAQDLVIGIDVGGQTTKCGIVDARGTVLAQTVIRSDNHEEPLPFIADPQGRAFLSKVQYTMKGAFLTNKKTGLFEAYRK